MKKVEYRIERSLTEQPVKFLNELGGEGWKLVGEHRDGYIFMRKVKPEEDPFTAVFNNHIRTFR